MELKLELTEKESPKIFTVSELNLTAKKSLEEKFAQIWVEGEVSNFKGIASSGHCYFSLKDETAQISAVAYRGVMSQIKFKLEDGMKVLLLGKITLYSPRGSFQILAQWMEPKGLGALQLAFEQLKKKLESEGLFDSKRKKPIPLLPQKIGIVTSPTGAAIRDILTIINRRFANIHILIYPVKVQGIGSKEEIREAIQYLNEHYKELDVLLVGRGGGSIEDLWSFNEEIVARAIAASKIPVISCVGHEIDFTIADFVADLRAPTPSAAAELVVKNKLELQTTLDFYANRLKQNLLSTLEILSEKLRNFSRSPVILKPQSLIEERLQTVDLTLERMVHIWERKTSLHNNDLVHLGSRLAHLTPHARLEENKKKVELFYMSLKNLIERTLQKLGEKTSVACTHLEALSPLAVLSRGYAIAFSLPENKILKSNQQVAPKDEIRIKLHDGEIKATVRSVEI